jgi:hypothetical protein
MPAWRLGQRIGVKLVTVFSRQYRRAASGPVGAVYALFDARNGKALALFDGEEITACRTAGASATPRTGSPARMRGISCSSARGGSHAGWPKRIALCGRSSA